MTLRLILMRHAKSDWHVPAADDFDRPLNKRGRVAASTIGRWLGGAGYEPALILCSAARRTRETCALVVEGFKKPPEIEFSEALYLASPEAMFQTIACKGSVTPLMMIAHNPGSSMLARALVEHAPPHPRFDDYPTAATTVMDFDIASWSNIAAGAGKIMAFVVPRDLAE